MNVQQMPQAWAESAWLLAEPMLSKVIEHSMGCFDMEELHRSVASGDRKIILAMSGVELIGVILVRYQQSTNGVIAWVTAAAGKCVASQEAWAKVKAIFKANGATAVQGVMRPAVLRLWNQMGVGLTEKYRAYGAPL